MLKYARDLKPAILNEIKRGHRLFLFLDYDGTLTGFRREPMDARPSKRTRDILSRLASNPEIEVTIVSGRAVSSLMELFGDFDTSIINWSGAHGVQMRYRGEQATRSLQVIPEILSLRDKISGMISPYQCCSLEDKEISFAVHYRRCPGDQTAFLEPVRQLLDSAQQDRKVEVLEMKKVIEVKPAGVNKGNSIREVVSRWDDDGRYGIICIGDDVTDEYLFQDNTCGINIKVARDENTETAADYYLRGVTDVSWFLRQLLRTREES